MGGTLPGYGKARRPHRRVPRETPSTISFSLKPSSRRSHPTPVSTRVLHIVARCTRRSAAPRQNVDSNGLEHRVFQENRHKALGFSSMDDFINQFHVLLLQRNGSKRSAVHGMEMASAATLAATPMATCGRHWAGSKPRRVSCRCLRICFSRRSTAKPSGGSFPMRSSGLSKPSMGISHYSAMPVAGDRRGRAQGLVIGAATAARLHSGSQPIAGCRHWAGSAHWRGHRRRRRWSPASIRLVASPTRPTTGMSKARAQIATWRSASLPRVRGLVIRRRA